MMRYEEQLKSMIRNDVWIHKKKANLVFVFEVGEKFYVRYQSGEQVYAQKEYFLFISTHTRLGEL